MAGTAVFRIVVSNDSMKNATATSHGNNRLLDGLGELTAERIGIAFDTSRTRTRRAWHSDPESQKPTSAYMVSLPG